MSQNPGVQTLVREYIEKKKLVGMICAGHIMLFDLVTKFNSVAGSLAALTSKLPKQPLTSHPSVKSQLENCMAMQGIFY